MEIRKVDDTLVICKCADCGIEFEYDYKVSICDECLTKYKSGELPKNNGTRTN